MKTSELTGTDLNKAVAECLGIKHTRFQGQVIDQFWNPLMYDDDWSLAGEIIERHWCLVGYAFCRWRGQRVWQPLVRRRQGRRPCTNRRNPTNCRYAVLCSK
jgi:hypothetical protein